MPSSFNSIDLFGPGPHRFAQGPQGNAIIPLAVLAPLTPGTTAYGMLDLEVIVTGRLVADSESDLWTKRNAIAAVLASPAVPATLIDHHAHSWTNMTFYRFIESDRTDRGRKHSLSFTALFRKNLLSTAGDG